MSSKINYILADDDELSREYLIQLLDNITELNCMAVCKSAFETRDQLQIHQPDFLLLDVEMPGLSGIQLAKSLKNPPLTVFITSHSKFAADAFELDAVDFIVKPVVIERLLRTIEKIKMFLNTRANYDPSDHFTVNDSNSFFIKEKHIHLRYAYADLVYTEAIGDFINFHFEDGTKKIVLASVKSLEQQLPAGNFIRINRGQIINSTKVSSFDSQANVLHAGKLQFTIGKSYIAQVKNNFINRQTIHRF